MPRFQLTDNDTGDTLTVDADTPPTDEDIAQAFTEQRQQKAAPMAAAPKPAADIPVPPIPKPESLSSQIQPLPVTDMGPDISAWKTGIVGPENVPSGAAITEATGIPKSLSIPASAVAKAGAGALGYMTSPEGAYMTAASKTAAAPAVFAKWAYDMISGGYQSGKDAVDTVKEMIQNAVNNRFITANNLGSKLEGVTDDAHVQRLAEDAVNTAVMALGAAGAGAHAAKLGLSAIPAPMDIPPGKVVEMPEPTPDPTAGVELPPPTTPTERTPNAVQPEAAPPIRPLREEPVESPEQVPAEEGGRAPDERGSEAPKAAANPVALTPAAEPEPEVKWKGLTIDQVRKKLPIGFDESTARIEGGRIIATEKPDYGGREMFVDIKKGEASPVNPEPAPTPTEPPPTPESQPSEVAPETAAQPAVVEPAAEVGAGQAAPQPAEVSASDLQAAINKQRGIVKRSDSTKKKGRDAKAKLDALEQQFRDLQSKPAPAGTPTYWSRESPETDIRRVKPNGGADSGERVRLANGDVWEYKGISGYKSDNAGRVNGWERVAAPEATTPTPIEPTPVAAAKVEAQSAKVESPVANGGISDANVGSAGANGETPPLTSMGGMAPGDPLETAGQRGGDYVSNMFAAIDKDRAERGLDPMEATIPRTWAQARAKAEAKLRGDPYWISELIASTNREPRPLRDDEVAGLVLQRAKWKAELNDAYKRINRAVQDGQPESVNEQRLFAAQMTDRLELLDKTVGRGGSGSEAGRTLNAQKMALDDDLNLVSMVQKKEATLGRKVTDKELGDLQKIADEHKATADALEAHLRDRDQKLAEANAKIALDAVELSNRPRIDPYIVQIAEKIGTKVHSAADAARERIKARLGSVKFGSGPLHEIPNIKDFAIIGADHIYSIGLDAVKWGAKMVEELGEGIRPHLDALFEASKKEVERIAGVTPDTMKRVLKRNADAGEQRADLTERIAAKLKDKRLDEITPLVERLARTFSDQGVRGWRPLGDAVHGVLKQIIPGLDYRDTLDAISGHGQFRIPNQAEGAKALRDAKSQIQEVRKIQEVIARQPVKPTGLKRDLPSDVKRRLTQIYENAKRKFGVTVTDPETQLRSALQSRKTYYEHRISDLQAEINSRKRTVKTKATSPTDAALEKLVADYKQVKAAHDEVFGPRTLTDEQRAALEVKSLDRQIGEVERQIKEGDIFPGSKAPRPTSPEIEARRANLEALKAEREYLRESVQPKSTPEQAELDAVNKRRDQLQKRIDETERKINTGDVEVVRKAKTPEATSELQGMRDDLDRLNKMVGEMRAAVRPGLTDAQRLAGIKSGLLRSIANKTDRMARGDFSPVPKRPPPAFDAETQRLQAENVRVAKKYRQMEIADEQSKAGFTQRAIAFAQKVRRFEILSGLHSIYKLASFSLQKFAGTPLEEAVGAGLFKLPGLRGIGEKSTELGYNTAKELGYIKAGFTQGIKDAGQVWKRGESDLGALYDQRVQKDVEWTGFFGRLHLMEKSPLLRASFERAKDRLIDHYGATMDVSDPAVATRIGVEAYDYAMQQILMNPTALSKRVNRFLESLAEKDKATGKTRPGLTALKTAIEYKAPIRNVPINYIARTMEYVAGLPMGGGKLLGRGVARLFGRAVEDLTPAEANVIKNHLTRGSIGLGVMALGYLNPKMFGGYYQPGEKRPAKDVKALGLRIMGVNVPQFLAHNPLIEAAQFGATIRRVADSKLRKRDQNTQGIGSGVAGALLGLIDEAPYVRAMLDYAKLRNPQERGHVLSDETKSVLIPQMLQNIAQDLDTDSAGEPIHRKPKTFWQGVEAGIPGLRQTVPKK